MLVGRLLIGGTIVTGGVTNRTRSDSITAVDTRIVTYTQYDPVQLALTALVSSDQDVNGTTCGIRVTRAGQVYEIKSGTSFIAQNSGTEWCDATSSTIGDVYQVNMAKLSGDNPYFTSDDIDTWLTINTTREWQWVRTTSGSTQVCSYVLAIRKIADTTKVASTTVYIWGDVNNPPPAETIQLTGTSSVPNTNSIAGSAPDAGWQFNANGTITRLRSSGDTVVASWCDTTPVGTYWIRCTSDYFEGDGGFTSGNMTLGTWNLLESNRKVGEIDDPAGTGPTIFRFKAEISNVGSDTGIQDTGYYQSTVENEDAP